MGSARYLGADISARVLERLPFGLLIVDSAGDVRWMNQAARDLVSAKPGQPLAPSTGKISGEKRNRLIANVLAALAAVGCLTSRQSARTATARDLPGGALPFVDEDGEELTLVTIAPRETDEPDLELTQQILGLSPTQARIVTLLSSGRRLKEIASTIGVTEGTARQYLKIIFDKTGARRQSDLVRLVADIPAMSVATLSE